ncbi:uncharacterized protein LOC100841295 [Brachypodium distachyon]|uniref:Uncharacterized protein n=1 Tax=Brachypodium distachyon TaxID=15368 RepID=A0A0Q3LDN1_BRADI|nr:uncharacterized protein LOC100841295 [Brachypodium distachyon]KQK21105.1 hypothetical protein BRADI_1g58743v3 [Brachypodium distachyon]|eukprot:XP_010230104.1 uncharacterized protein LOC100841295 [Brachypodium distachyon]
MPPPPPELPAELVEEIFLRLPPDDPGCLFRASLVSESWLRRLAGPAFRRRYCEFHRTPPMLGFLTSGQAGEDLMNNTHFVPTVKLCPPGPGHKYLQALDARHSRILFLTDPEDSIRVPRELIIWDPITLEEWTIPDPGLSSWAAVLCAKEGCDHLDCHGHPFLVACVSLGDEEFSCSAILYSSETDSWSDETSVDHDEEHLTCYTYVDYMPPNVLVGNTLYFDCHPFRIIIQYDLADRELSLIDTPDVQDSVDGQLTVENDVLGFAKIKESSIYLWLREVDEHGAAAWVQLRVIKLEKMFSSGALSTKPTMYAFAEGVGVIFLWGKVGLFMIDLKSGRAKKVCYQGKSSISIIPYMSFYTPGHDWGIMPLPPGPPAIDES